MKEDKLYQVNYSKVKNWERADLLTDFCFPWLDKPAPRTEFKALWDDTSLHFRFDITDGDIVLDSSEDYNESVLGSDRAELFFSPCPDLSLPYYGLEMDPRGRTYDYEGIFHRQFDPTWKMPDLQVEGTVYSGGYRVEGSLSLGVLKELGCLRDQKMITGVYRAEFSHVEDGSVRQDWIAWVDPESSVPDFIFQKLLGSSFLPNR